MKFCSRHQEDIAQALRRKGMWHLVSLVPGEVSRRTQLWLAGQATAGHLDPLVVTTLEINTKAARFCGGYVMSRTIQYCPLCEVTHALGDAKADTEWIDNCTDAVLLVCEANGIIKVS